MKIRWISIFLSILLVVLLVLVTPIIILANRGMLSISEFISLLSIVFSWPTAALIISLTFFARFYDAIESLLKNVGSMKFPGGFEIQRQDQNPPVKEADIKSKDLLAPPNQDKLNEIGDALSEIQKDKKISENDIQLLKKQHSELVNAVKFWKFSYLSQFFVQQTKNVLLWFSQSAPQTRQSYDIIWTPYIFDQNQRNIILSVLLQNGMVSESAGLIRITEEGYFLLQFIGYIPSTPAQQAA